MQKSTQCSIAYGFLGAAMFSLLTHAGPAIAQVAKSLVQLQPSTPGSAQPGNVNVTGRVIAGQLQGDGASVTNLNASFLSSGTMADSRLSTNVMTLGGTQTVTGSKTFSTAPVFASASGPFSVSSSVLVPNLNADRLDGLSSASFLQSNPPIAVSGSNASPIFEATQTMNASIALSGKSTNAGTGVSAFSTGAGGAALRASGTNFAWAASFSGDVYLEHNQDNLMKDFTGGGSYSGCIPIAYGIINSDGTIRTGTGNFEVTKPGLAWARIHIDGMNSVSGVVTSVTPVGSIGSSPRFCLVTGNTEFNSIDVSTFDINGTQASANFTFVVYKLLP